MMKVDDWLALTPDLFHVKRARHEAIVPPPSDRTGAGAARSAVEMTAAHGILPVSRVGSTKIARRHRMSMPRGFRRQ